MGRITEMHVFVAIVTMVTVNFAAETNYFDAWVWDSEVNLVLMGLRLRKYIELWV